ncbi:hypothetical protein Poli38472_007266 [Pythium oligandrum]|uniref:Transmembrane protein 19 n=1 Tax=Pythium oligandrum TaxID=41045 RepID=A0A8K1C9F1_PYTOL|nr:hypothetical protein Poli38472_007266 [Pythium oligandrum]|eukprot:TMW59121.1 hypothetical protein Poli38472_007266 [Pythium oligandrum]
MTSVGMRLAVAAALALLLARRGLKKQSLDVSGAVAAFLVGFGSMAAGYRFGVLLIGFYFSGSKLTNVRASVKSRLDANYKVGGQRSAPQVLACSLIATVIAVYYAFLFGESDTQAIDFKAAPVESALLTAYIGHYACCAADTWASELGVLSTHDPVLITSFKRVPPGTNGGVSLLGTAASTAGGAFIGLLYYLVSLLTGGAQLQVVPFGAVAGLIGSLLDSLLGATLQSTYFDPETRQICEETHSLSANSRRMHISGLALLTNEQVNAISVVLVTLGSVGLAHVLI